ncbi:MAG: ArsB/NhaD family transporter [Candidatus Thermoplasmatota archaeon]|nr:ArsB/NhaD family transporter [Candidatus Thermoplasmatota archaeon]
MIDIGIDPKIVAGAVFLLTYGMILSNKINRTIAALAGAMLLFLFGILSGEQILQKINWEAIGLIFGMFVMVGALSESGFFRWIGLKTIRFVKFDVVKAFIMLSILSAFLSAFMDSITVLLFMSTLTIEACKLMKINPVPFIISEICSANIGGSATMMGDPPNIIIGTGCELSFLDFIANTGIVAVVVFAVNILFFYFWYRKGLKKDKVSNIHKLEGLKPEDAIKDKRLMVAGIAVFVVAVILLVFHAALHIPFAFIGIFGASLILLTGGKKMPEVIEKIDWLTLIFFAGLFIVIGGLEETGILDIVASLLIKGGSNPLAIAMVLLWVFAFLSAFVDNVPLAATMVPVIKILAATPGVGLGLNTMAWSLAIGTDIGGNATPIGASANVIGLAVAEKNGFPVSWKYYCKVGFASMIISIAAASLVIWLKYFVL